MSERCPECNLDLIELHTVTTHVSTGWVGCYSETDHYGYWCPYHEKMYVKKHKEWIESWKYDSSNQTKIGDNKDE